MEQKTWFEKLTGFAEESPAQVRQKIMVEGNLLRSRINGKAYVWGTLETPSLAHLRQRVSAGTQPLAKLSLRQVVADVQQLHSNSENTGALFQVASQFNLLEMISPTVSPEQGVGIYEHDQTQGPACAIAAGAGTIYRNYFANVNGQTGQSAANQIDCLADLGVALGNADNRLWEMRNGYALPSPRGLAEIAQRLRVASERELDGLRQLLRIGMQWNTQVTINNAQHTLSQAYCSALPVAYTAHPAYLWEPFARLVLEAAYEATICAAILNAQRGGSNRLFLTLLGGGAFGNKIDWIFAAMQRALSLYQDAGLDVAIVSYGSPNPDVDRFIARQNSLDGETVGQ